MDTAEREIRKSRCLARLARHIGQERAIGMDVLYEYVFGKTVRHKINDTRQLRTLITSLRREGVPIASVSDRSGGGYYLPAAGSEQVDQVRRYKSRGLRALALAASLSGTTLDEYLGQIRMNLRGETGDAVKHQNDECRSGQDAPMLTTGQIDGLDQ